MYLHTVDLGLDSLIQLQTELVELGVVTSTERVGPEWPASPVAVGDGLCWLGVCDGCAKCDDKAQASEGHCQGGGLFPNFLEFYPIIFPNDIVKKGISQWL